MNLSPFAKEVQAGYTHSVKLHPQYILGFIDGEGTLNVVRYPDGRVRPQLLIFNTDKNILELIKSSLQVSAPIFEVTRVEDKIKRTKPCYRLQARSKSDIEKVMQFLIENPPYVKNKDFKVFEKAYSDWFSG